MDLVCKSEIVLYNAQSNVLIILQSISCHALITISMFPMSMSRAYKDGT